MRFKDITKDNHFKFSGFLYLLTDIHTHTRLSPVKMKVKIFVFVYVQSLFYFIMSTFMCVVCVFVRSTSDISSLPPTTKYISNDFIIYGKIYTHMHVVDDDYVGKILIKYFCFKILKIFSYLTHMSKRKKEIYICAPNVFVYGMLICWKKRC